MDDTITYVFFVSSVPCPLFMFILGVGNLINGAHDPKILTQPRFLCNAPTHQVLVSYV